ncbi:MAG: serine/threonine protein kinase, partial [Candidatus Krumholzibacteria bacterium]|nr:serine/threonine protein kinase [Candidatus Krumholzibacteria bacterium]
MIGSTVSHFRILRRLGAGGMGVVFKAEDLRVPGRVVALKILNAELVADENLKKRFLIEARAASSLDHPNICQIGEVDETDEGRPFMTMSFYGGPSLRHMLSEAPLDPFTSLQIAYSLAQGLSCAHRRGIIHRDIKPGNVMINDEGYVKIVDFGLARLAGETRITHSDMTLGTVAYMSPQQANGQDVDGRTDIWSLGVVLFEMLTGKLPFRGTIDQALVYSILNEDHQSAREANPKVGKEVSKIVDRCLEKDVDKRYQTADSLIEDLLDVARDMGWESSIAGATVAPISWTQKRQRVIRYRTAAVIALAVIVAGFAGYKL